MTAVNHNPRRLILLVGIPALIALFVVAGWGKKYAADKEMQALCAIDGGVKIYEKVTLPANEFSQWGEALYKYRIEKDPEKTLGPDFRYVSRSEFLKRGDTLIGEVQMRRSHAQIFRRSDGKLLGESVFYGRSGGDHFINRILAGHPSAATCPVGPDTLFSLFVKGE